MEGSIETRADTEPGLPGIMEFFTLKPTNVAIQRTFDEYVRPSSAFNPDSRHAE
jgi:hypothetical protein